jgi:hypothetical protein
MRISQTIPSEFKALSIIYWNKTVVKSVYPFLCLTKEMELFKVSI